MDNSISEKKEYTGIWTKEDELQRNLNSFSNLTESIAKLSILIQELNPYIKKFDNIGNIINNKIIEIYNEFNNRNVDYSHSKVNRSICDYFTILLNEAITELEKYANVKNNKKNTKVSELVTMKRFLLDKDKVIDNIQRYNDICNMIYNFDLNKDSKIAINISIDSYLKSSISEGWYDGKINEDIDKYNDELEQLGIGRIIEYREDTERTNKR